MPYNGKHPAQLAVEIEGVLAAICLHFGIESLSVSLDVGGGRTNLAYGPGARRLADDQSPLFAVGCMLDLIVSVLCLDLHFRSGLDLDLPVEAYLPELKAEHPDAITIRHLLTRTSGIQDPRSIDEMRQFIRWDDLAVRISAAPRIFSPGTAFSYGGIDRVILSVLIERFSAKSITQLVDELILRPCDLTQRPEQLGLADGEGRRPIERFDPANFIAVVAALASDGADSPTNPFCRALRDLLQREQLQLNRAVKSPAWPHAPTGFTPGLFKYSDGLTGFNGFEAGDSAAVRYDPLNQISFVVAVKGPPQVRDRIVAEIADRLGYLSVQSRARPCTIGGLNGLSVDEIAGRYQGWAAGYEAEVTVHDGVLICDLQYNDHRFRQLRIDIEENAWLVVDSIEEAASLEFYRDSGTGCICMASGYLPYVMWDGVRP